VPRYLETSRRLAAKFISLLDPEIVPIWDFRLDSGQPPLRDSSAAAIAACGLLELGRQFPGEAQFAETADALLSRLCSPDYFDERLECPGVLRQGQVGDGLLPGGLCYKAKSVYTSWGDYFFMEALGTKVYGLPTFW
jgi:unsaturated chondroitin disaccharide hydrolase